MCVALTLVGKPIDPFWLTQCITDAALGRFLNTMLDCHHLQLATMLAYVIRLPHLYSRVRALLFALDFALCQALFWGKCLEPAQSFARLEPAQSLVIAGGGLAAK